jgi:hypothetical protein
VLNQDFPRLTLAPGVEIEKLVCVRFDPGRQRFFCKQPGCYDSLADSLYKRGRGIRKWLSADMQQVWLDRWRDIILQQRHIDCVPVPQAMIADLPGRRWLVIRADSWEMPVSVPAQSEVLRGDYHFFPSTMDEPSRGVIGRFIAPMYKADQDSFWPMERFSGTFALSPPPPSLAGEQDVDIFLHPFISPQKWHFGVWKHLLCPTTETEQRYWQLHCPVSVDDGSGHFAQCAANPSNTSCQPCSNSQFARVHDELRAALHDFRKVAVTFFNDLITRQTGGVIFSAESLGTDLYSVELILKGKLRGSKDQPAGRELLHQGVFRGMLIIGSPRNALHLHPVTQYPVSAGAFKLTLGRNVRIGTIRNVQKSN